MKYYNKNPALRKKWTHVAVWVYPYSMADMKRWCQLNGSSSRFWCSSFYGVDWYFENPVDALAFSLKFKGTKRR